MVLGVVSLMCILLEVTQNVFIKLYKPKKYNKQTRSKL